jgi:hypothetical protein
MKCEPRNWVTREPQKTCFHVDWKVAVARGETVKQYVALLISFLVISVTAFSQTYSDSNLAGKYFFQTVKGETAYWYKTFSCPYNGQTYIYQGGGSVTFQTSFNGYMVFTGIGNVPGGSFTISGKFNQTASNNTVKITFDSSCNSTVNNGQAVFLPATAPQAFLGIYQVNSDGTGFLSASLISKSTPFRLAGTTPAGISNTVLFWNINAAPTQNKVSGTGIAVHQ